VKIERIRELLAEVVESDYPYDVAYAALDELENEVDNLKKKGHDE